MREQPKTDVSTDPLPFRKRFWRRRRFIVDLRFQAGLTGAFLAQLVIFSAILTSALFIQPILAMRDKSASDSSLLDAANRMLALHHMYWPALMAAGALAVMLALRTSHKIAGPLYRFRRVFEALQRGEDPGPVRLRKGDYLKPEAEFLDKVARSVVRDRERMARLEDGIRGIVEEAAQDDVKGRLTALLQEDTPSP